VGFDWKQVSMVGRVEEPRGGERRAWLTFPVLQTGAIENRHRHVNASLGRDNPGSGM
jgi:hypothetical protein